MVAGLTATFRGWRRLALLVALLATVVGIGGVPGVGAQPSGTLAGEYLEGSVGGIGASNFEPGSPHGTPCNTQGNSTFSYEVRGAAFGPYPGTFVERGTATVGPQQPGAGFQGSGAGPLLDFRVSFTIYSGDTTITGTKRLVTSAPSLGTCEFDETTGLSYYLAKGLTEYEARIQGPEGTATVTGLANTIYYTSQFPTTPASFQPFEGTGSRSDS